MCIRAVKLAEKLNSNFLLKYYTNSNLKGINSVREKKLLASLRPQEAHRAKYYQMHDSSK